MTTRRCSRCKLYKPLDQFSPSFQVKAQGEGGYCLPCRQAYDHDRKARLWQEYKASPTYLEEKAAKKRQTQELRREREAHRRAQKKALQAAIKRAVALEKAAVSQEVREVKRETLQQLRAARAVQREIERYFRKSAQAIGLDPDDMWRRYQEHDGLCDCCKNPDPTGKRLAMDHDHTTGQFRGFLCATCNQGIGMLGDTREGVARALDYLSR